MKKKHIDFTIKDGYRKRKMRFYPKQSHCHSFNENPPKSWNEVYKVYYSWKILSAYKDENFYPVFEMDFDECSAITYLPDTIEWVVKKKKNFYRVLTFGQPGSDWDLRYRKAYGYGHERTPEDDTLEITVVNNWTNQAFRFILRVKDEIPEFVKYLREVNEHMLENGEEI